jgi:hypothetical protein
MTNVVQRLALLGFSVAARAANEQKNIERIGQLPAILYLDGHVAKRGSVDTGYHSFSLVEYSCDIDDVTYKIPFIQNNDSGGTQTVTVRAREAGTKDPTRLMRRLISNESVFPIPLDDLLKRLNAELKRSTQPPLVITAKPTRVVARVSPEYDANPTIDSFERMPQKFMLNKIKFECEERDHQGTTYYGKYSDHTVYIIFTQHPSGSVQIDVGKRYDDDEDRLNELRALPAKTTFKEALDKVSDLLKTRIIKQDWIDVRKTWPRGL